MNTYISSTDTALLLSYDSGLLRKQIAENSKKIDEYLRELKQLEYRLTGKLPTKAIA